MPKEINNKLMTTKRKKNVNKEFNERNENKKNMNRKTAHKTLQTTKTTRHSKDLI